MCANVERLKSRIIDNLNGLTELLRDWQSSFCASTSDDNRRHFREIHLLIDRMRNHVHSIELNLDGDVNEKKKESMEVLRKVEENVVIKTCEMIVKENSSKKGGITLTKNEEKIMKLEENIRNFEENTRLVEESIKSFEENARKFEENMKENRNSLMKIEEKLGIVTKDEGNVIDENIHKYEYSLNKIEEKIKKLEENTTTLKNNKEIEKSIVNIPADVIEKRINEEKSLVNYRNKSVRDAPSWEFLDKWNEILNEESTSMLTNNNDDKFINKNFTEEDYHSVNLIVSKRIQQFGGSKRQKYNSTECILEETNDKLESSTSISKKSKNYKKSSSTGDLLENVITANDEMTFRDFYGSNYLLSLRDLQSFDKVNKFVDSDDEFQTSDDENNIHKPKIVGVIYKEKL